MEEDIKILEDMITWDCLLPNKRQTEAIENLIKGYRELEKRIIQLTNLLCINDSDENYIPKSKIIEKIEELKKEYEIALEENSTKAFILKCQIDILEKLMEDK